MCQATTVPTETSSDLMRPSTPIAGQRTCAVDAPPLCCIIIVDVRQVLECSHRPLPTTGCVPCVPKAPKRVRTTVHPLPTISTLNPEDGSEVSSRYTALPPTPRRETLLASVDGSMVFLSRKRLYEAFFPPVQQCVCKHRPCSFCEALQQPLKQPRTTA